MSILRPDVRARAGFLGVILLFHSVMWAVALAIAPDLVEVRQWVAEIISTLALVLLSVNLLLSTRARFLERLLKGLDKLFVTHRLIGLSVVLLAISHALTVPSSEELVPARLGGYAVLALLLGAVTAAAAPRMPWRRLVPLPYQTWKSTHRFMGLIVAMAVSHSLIAETYVRQVPILAGYVWGVAGLGLVAWLYRELLFARTGPFRDYEVERSRVLGGDVTEVVLRSDAEPLERDPGQFLCVAFEDGPSREQHPFTVSSGTGESIRFSIKAIGDFTGDLRRGVPDGSKVRVEGPYGAFTYKRGRRYQLWLPGGIGITPFLSMAADLDDTTKVLLVWSVREPTEAIYREELELIAREKSNFHFVIHTTSGQGHLRADEIQLDAEPEQYSAFLCGPLSMQREFSRQLRARGVPPGEIYFEEFRFR